MREPPPRIAGRAAADPPADQSPAARGRGPMVLLAACGAVIVAGAVGVAAVGDVRQGDVAARVWWFVGLFGAQFAAFLLALIAVRRLAGRGAGCRRGLVLGLAVALSARLILVLFSWPNLSDDLHRYVWEGMAQHHRINPYLTKPNEAPAEVRDTPAGRAVTHGHVSTIYPPLTELVFRLIHPLARTARGYRATLLLFDLGTVIVVAGLLRRIGQSPLWAIAYAWHPLIITEFAGSGHFDSLGIFWMMVAVYLLKRRRGLWAYAALGASVATKYLAAPLALFFWPRTRTWHAVALVAVVGLLFWPYLPGGYTGVVQDAVALVRGESPPYATWRIFDGLRFFLARYHSNAGLHRGVLFITGEQMWHDPAARVVTGLMLLSVIGGLFLGRASVATAGLHALGAIVVLGRVIHPWYACWIVPWLALRAAQQGTAYRWSTGAWLWFTGLVATSYTVLIGYVRTLQDPEPVWMVPTWSMGLQYVPLVVLLVVAALHRLGRWRSIVRPWRTLPQDRSRKGT